MASWKPSFGVCAGYQFSVCRSIFTALQLARDALATLRKIAEFNQLCLIKTGLESP